MEDLVIEALQIYSMDSYYLPRESRDQIDYLLGEDALKSFPNAYVLEFYIENTTAMEGEGDLMSKFGLEIRDETTLLVSRRRFRSVVPNLERPREGDVIYLPLMQNFFEIVHVEHENNQAMFYTLGRGRNANFYVYALRLRQMVFSEEQIQTGIEEVDDQIRDSYRPLYLTMSTGVRDYNSDDLEIIYQGSSLNTATATANVSSWDSSTKLLGAIRVTGTFQPNVIVKGVTSNAQWTLSTVDSDTPLDEMFEDLLNNKQIQDEANTIIDWSESNPFGNP